MWLSARAISIRTIVNWDLNSVDLFLWGYLNDMVYKSHLQTLHELKQIVPAVVMGIGVTHSKSFGVVLEHLNI